MPALDGSQCPVVESVPGKVSGAWVLKGTRMPVSAIFENLAALATLDRNLQSAALRTRVPISGAIRPRAPPVAALWPLPAVSR